MKIDSRWKSRAATAASAPVWPAAAVGVAPAWPPALRQSEKVLTRRGSRVSPVPADIARRQSRPPPRERWRAGTRDCDGASSGRTSAPRRAPRRRPLAPGRERRAARSSCRCGRSGGKRTDDPGANARESGSPSGSDRAPRRRATPRTAPRDPGAGAAGGRRRAGAASSTSAYTRPGVAVGPRRARAARHGAQRTDVGDVHGGDHGNPFRANLLR